MRKNKKSPQKKEKATTSTLVTQSLTWAINEPPTEGKHFYVYRKELLKKFEREYVEKELKVVVYGHEQAGKSTFALQLARYLTLKKYRVVIVTCQANVDPLQRLILQMGKNPDDIKDIRSFLENQDPKIVLICDELSLLPNESLSNLFVTLKTFSKHVVHSFIGFGTTQLKV